MSRAEITLYFKGLETEFSNRIDDYTKGEIDKELFLSEIMASINALYNRGLEEKREE